MSKQPDQVPTDDEIYVVEAWKKRAELAQAEINELKQKLARYENPDYVLVPRTPNKKMLKEMESGYYFEQGWSHYFGEEAYERMLKAVEKEHE